MNSYAGWLGDDGGDDQPSLSTTEGAHVMANTGSFYLTAETNGSACTRASIGSDDNFTLAAWIKWTKEGNKSVIFFQGQPDNQGLHFGIDLTSRGPSANLHAQMRLLGQRSGIQAGQREPVWQLASCGLCV